MRLRLQLGFLVVLIAALISTGASATLLYAGGEDSDFICRGSGNCSVTTTSFTFRPTWAREAYQVRGTTVDPATNRFATAPFSDSSEIWVHARYCNFHPSQCQTATTANAQMLRVMNSSGNATLIIRGTGTNGQVKISSRSASGSFTDLVTCSSAVNASLTQIDLYVKYGTSGELRLFNNAQEVCSYVGNVTNGDGATTLNQVEFSSVRLYESIVKDGVGAWSEVIVATTDTRAMARFSAYTVANGNTTGFSGTNICSSIWGMTAFDDASYGYSDTANVTHECTINSAVPPGDYDVVALVMSARALVGTAGPQHFSFLTRVNGTDYRSADFAPLSAFSNIANYIQTTNPATGNPWSVADFAAGGFNVGEETRP